MVKHNLSNQLINSRRHLQPSFRGIIETEGEGGCGVIGAACSVPVQGKHFLKALLQMHNRGNGKGGGVAVLGLDPEIFNVTQEVLDSHYIISIAFLDASCREEMEQKYIVPQFDIAAQGRFETIPDWKSIELEVEPPQVQYYLVRVKDDVLKQFMAKHDIDSTDTGQEAAKDEFIYQNSYQLNQAYYASLGTQRAFVLSHGKNLLIFKLVGYGEQVIQFYKLEDFEAHVWVGHHRFPTKGVVYHPGGAHPFAGLHEALVHNGDFANYHAITEYLSQRNMYPLFLTDTEVGVYLFDLYSRIYQYPTEYLIEALAPTTERDFVLLPEEKQNIYKELQHAHLHASPDGPWFFIIGRNKPQENALQLIGITDTSMLRPQVFALQEGEEKIGIVASERQAIDAMLYSLSSSDDRFASKADMYWNARGGSWEDGGAFLFNLKRENNHYRLICQDKFGNEIKSPQKNIVFDSQLSIVFENIPDLSNHHIISKCSPNYKTLPELCNLIKDLQIDIIDKIQVLTLILDRLHLIPKTTNGWIKADVETTLFQVFSQVSNLVDGNNLVSRIDWDSKQYLKPPSEGQKSLVVNMSDFPAEGDDSAALFIVEAYKLGWNHLYTYNWKGQRFCGSGLGPSSEKLRIDVYGNPGDYLASGLDGAEIYVHCDLQDQCGNLMKSGKLVAYGNVGQAFMYGAKGGEVYILGNAAGRPLINAVGNPKVVINGTSLDYLAESFMAGDPHNDGGFVILGGIKFDDYGDIYNLDVPYPGGNLFSLASGGALFVNDPNENIAQDQLHGGRFSFFSNQDYDLILPFLMENKNLFGVDLTKDSLTNTITNLYRKIEPDPIAH